MSEERGCRKVFLISGTFLVSSAGNVASDGPGERVPSVALGVLSSSMTAVTSPRAAAP